MLTAKVDAKGRVSIPTEVREHIGLETGDTMGFELDANGTFRVAKVANPFDAMRDEAVADRRAGRLRSLAYLLALEVGGENVHHDRRQEQT